MWSEAVEGTNGIGTCIADGRAVTVHQTQHFRSRHTGLSCSGAPVFDADARLVAVLDVSSMDPQLAAQAHALTLPLVVNFARQIEERLFRERFSHAWIIAIASEADQSGALLAVDREHRVIGADRLARRQFALDEHALETGTSVWTIFSRNSVILKRGVRSDYQVQPTCVLGGETLFALVSSPIALRRVQAYIAAHCHENLNIGTLASHVGLSRYHFSRAFKASVGMPPHRYLLEQRISKAAELIERSEQPLVNIAVHVGFADQAHFSRSFRAMVGLTPSQFRRAHR